MRTLAISFLTLDMVPKSHLLVYAVIWGLALICALRVMDAE